MWLFTPNVVDYFVYPRISMGERETLLTYNAFHQLHSWHSPIPASFRAIIALNKYDHDTRFQLYSPLVETSPRVSSQKWGCTLSVSLFSCQKGKRAFTPFKYVVSRRSSLALFEYPKMMPQSKNVCSKLPKDMDDKSLLFVSEAPALHLTRGTSITALD